MAAETVGEFYQRTEDEDATWPYKMDRSLSYIENRLVCGIKLANLPHLRGGQPRPPLQGHGHDASSRALVQGDKIYVGHVGDSRVLPHPRRRRSQQLTRDHSLLEDYKEAKPDMTEEEQRNFPHKNVITRALGMRETVQVDIKPHQIQGGDVYILCSDGLSGMVDDPQILRDRRPAPRPSSARSPSWSTPPTATAAPTTSRRSSCSASPPRPMRYVQRGLVEVTANVGGPRHDDEVRKVEGTIDFDPDAPGRRRSSSGRHAGLRRRRLVQELEAQGRPRRRRPSDGDVHPRARRRRARGHRRRLDRDGDRAAEVARPRAHREDEGQGGGRPAQHRRARELRPRRAASSASDRRSFSCSRSTRRWRFRRRSSPLSSTSRPRTARPSTNRRDASSRPSARRSRARPRARGRSPCRRPWW